MTFLRNILANKVEGYFTEIALPLKCIARKTYTAQQVLDHHKKFSTMSVQPHVRDIIMSHPKWVKIKLPLSELRPRHAMESLVDEYAEMKTKAPAIIAVKDGRNFYEALDGAHRTKAAEQKGEDDIDAFVPIDQIY